MVWVIGGTGMLGTALTSLLRERGTQVVATGSDVNIADIDALMRFAKDTRPTAIINAAAYTQVDAAEDNVDAAYLANDVGAGNVGAVAASLGIAALHVSTDYVFGALDARVPLDEDTAVAPLGAYGASKAAGEARFLSAAGACGTVVRTSWLFGAGGKNFVTTMIRLMRERGSVNVVADQHGRPTSTTGLADALLRLLDLPANERPRVVHYADAGATTWHGFAEAIADEAARLHFTATRARVAPIATADFPTKAKRPPFSVLSTDRYRRLTGAEPTPWRSSLAAYMVSLV
jgi:dTDP-4-dehydrorhamnose reductase